MILLPFDCKTDAATCFFHISFCFQVFDKTLRVKLKLRIFLIFNNISEMFNVVTLKTHPLPPSN